MDIKQGVIIENIRPFSEKKNTFPFLQEIEIWVLTW